MNKLPPVAVRAIEDAALEIIAEHGMDPATRPQAAAHEAGHVVVAHATGRTVKSAKLLKRTDLGRVLWGGMTYHTTPGYEEPKLGLVSDDPAGAFQLAVNSLAGFFGEMMAGFDHPASSVDERYYATSIAAALDAVWGKPEGYVQLQIGEFCWNVISRNRQQFDLVRTHLNRTGLLNRSDARRMLTHVKCFDLNTVVGGRAP